MKLAEVQPAGPKRDDSQQLSVHFMTTFAISLICQIKGRTSLDLWFHAAVPVLRIHAFLSLIAFIGFKYVPSMGHVQHILFWGLQILAPGIN